MPENRNFGIDVAAALRSLPPDKQLHALLAVVQHSGDMLTAASEAYVRMLYATSDTAFVLGDALASMIALRDQLAGDIERRLAKAREAGGDIRQALANGDWVWVTGPSPPKPR